MVNDKLIRSGAGSTTGLDVGNVYFVVCRNEFVKIGFAVDVRDRFGDLQTGCPYELKLVGVLPEVPFKAEKWFHILLRALHVRGEWFRLTDRVRLLIHLINSGARPDCLLELRRIYVRTQSQSKMQLLRKHGDQAYEPPPPLVTIPQ